MSHRGAGPRRSLQLPKVRRHPLFPPALPARSRRRRGPCGRRSDWHPAWAQEPRELAPPVPLVRTVLS